MRPESIAQERKHASPADAIEQQAKRTFTSEKMDLINAINADARISGNAYKVAICIINHVNEKAGYAFPSVETVGIKTRLSRSAVERALKLLRKTGWLRSRKVYDHKTRTQHNRYWLLDDNLNAIADEQVTLLEEAREARREGQRETPKTPAQSVAQPVTSDGTVREQPVTSDGTQPVTSEGVTPKREHLTRISASKKAVLVSKRGTEGAVADGWPDLRDGRWRGDHRGHDRAER
jgi:DNA-binding transcriptional regulator YhcF (GntR family)